MSPSVLKISIVRLSLFLICGSSTLDWLIVRLNVGMMVVVLLNCPSSRHHWLSRIEHINKSVEVAFQSYTITSNFNWIFVMHVHFCFYQADLGTANDSYIDTSFLADSVTRSSYRSSLSRSCFSSFWKSSLRRVSPGPTNEHRVHRGLTFVSSFHCTSFTVVSDTCPPSSLTPSSSKLLPFLIRLHDTIIVWYFLMFFPVTRFFLFHGWTQVVFVLASFSDFESDMCVLKHQVINYFLLLTANGSGFNDLVTWVFMGQRDLRASCKKTRSSVLFMIR